MAELTSLADAVAALVRDGDTVALEGFTHLIPHAAGHELIRQGRRELTLVRMTPDVIYDQLIGAGCAAKLVFSWGGNPGVGSLHRLRDAVEHGWPRPLELEEHSHAGMAAAYAAGAANLPFGVLRGYAGGDLPARDARRADHVPLHGRGARGGAGAPARRRRHPRPARRPQGQRAAVGDRRRAEGGRARLGALDRHGRGARRRARAAAGRGRAAALDARRGLRRAAAARIRPTRTATTSATTTSTSRGTRSAATATRSPPGSRSTCSARWRRERRGRARTRGDEMMAVEAARRVPDGTVCFVGIGLPSLAVNLARRLARARLRARLRERHDRREAGRSCRCRSATASSPRRRIPSSPCRRCSPTGCRAAASTSASSAPRRSTASATSTAR